MIGWKQLESRSQARGSPQKTPARRLEDFPMTLSGDSSPLPAGERSAPPYPPPLAGEGRVGGRLRRKRRSNRLYGPLTRNVRARTFRPLPCGGPYGER